MKRLMTMMAALALFAATGAWAQAGGGGGAGGGVAATASGVQGGPTGAKLDPGPKSTMGGVPGATAHSPGGGLDPTSPPFPEPDPAHSDTPTAGYANTPNSGGGPGSPGGNLGSQ